VELRPSFADSQYHLGFALEKSGDVKASRTALEKALKLDPNSKNATDALEVLKRLSVMGS